MKLFFRYILPLLLLFTAGCSKEDAMTDTDGRTGVLKISISATRSETDTYDPTARLVVRIYNKDGGLLRKYSSKQDIPAQLELLAGEYRVAVEAGEVKDASFEARSYMGEKTFTVLAGQVTPVEVVCNIRNTVIEAKFDATIAKNFGSDFHVWVAASETLSMDDVLLGKVPALKYTTDAKGYFTLPEDLTQMSWGFEGEHPQRGTIRQTGTTDPNVRLKAGVKYKLTFQFSPDLPGYVDAVLIKVDPSTDDQDDTLIFSQDPDIAGDGFNMNHVQKYVSGEKRFKITTMAEMQGVTFTIDGQSYELLGSAPVTVEGIQTKVIDGRSFDVVLSDALFAGRAAGSHELAFYITDTEKGELTANTTFRLQGLMPVSESSYSLWHNSLTLQVVTFDADAEASFSLSDGNGEPIVLAGTKSDTEDDLYTAVFAPTWVTSTNGNGQTVFSAQRGTGISVGTTYTYSVTAGAVSASDTFTTPAGDIIPDGDMENGSLPCFAEKDASATTTFWGSGNNNNTKTLCTQGAAGDNHYANMQSTFYIAAPAAGNLFAGTFNFSGTTGTVGFGQKYNFTARPSAMRLKYHAKVGTVDYNKAGGPLSVGAPDRARVFVAVVDWNTRHKVTSAFSIVGSSSCDGSWNPEEGMNVVKEGKILGYGVLWIDATTEGDALVSSDDALTLYWYDKEAPAPTSNYTLVISCSANAFGDFFNGCSTNHLWVDDFEWVY